MDNASTTGNAIELCCGMGGVSIGLRAAGFSIAAGYDISQKAIDIYRGSGIADHAETLDLLGPDSKASIRKTAKAEGGIDLLAAGPPCKGVSRLRNGNGRKNHDHNDVISAIPQYVALLRPRWVLIENVLDLSSHDEGNLFRQLIAGIESPKKQLHYRVTHAVYDAAQHGTPQVRRRVFLLGIRGKRSKANIPAADPDLRSLYIALRKGKQPKDALHKKIAARFADAGDSVFVSADQALSDLPLLLPGQECTSQGYFCEPRNPYQELMREDTGQTVTDLRPPGVKEKTTRRLLKIPPGGSAQNLPQKLLKDLSREYASAYRRLHPGAPSTTLNTRYDCAYHYAVPRSLSVREYARLQGIPDRVKFPADKVCRRTAYELIGNSVPPQLIKWFVEEAILDG